MAFNPNFNIEFNSNWNNNYYGAGSDSEDHLKPRTVITAADYFQPAFVRTSSTNSLFFESTPNKFETMQSNFNSNNNEAQISYNKFIDDFDLTENMDFYNADNNEMVDELFFFADKEQQGQLNNDMEIEEESDYHSTAITFDNEDSRSIFSERQSYYETETINNSIRLDAGSIDTSNAFKKNFLKMRELIDKILQGRQIGDSELTSLSEYERDILIFIIQKKTKSEGAKTSKRREEKQKLFFKSALKFIEKRFMTNISKENKAKITDTSIFYITYFQEVANQKGLDISAFYPPNQRRGRSTKSELKTFNLKYIELILSSKRFLEETIEFLDNAFVQTYSKSRYKKIDRILEKAIDIFDQAYKQFVSSNSQNVEGFMELVKRRLEDLILNNSKSKLPWSDAELNETKEFARHTIRKICEKSIDMV